MSEWISVKDGLPDFDLDVLGSLLSCQTSKRSAHVITRVDASDHDWEIDGYEISNAWDITHWMPLPKPPEDL